MDLVLLQLASDDVVELQLDVRIDGGDAVITVSGEIDAATVPILRRALDRVAGQNVSVVVDLSGVTFAGGCAIHALLETHHRLAATNRALTLRNVTPAVALVLAIADVDAVLTIDQRQDPISFPPGDSVESSIQMVTEELEGLRRAMETRAVIEQAKGVIMGATNRDADHAFDLLRQQSQHQNRKLRDVAADIVADVTRPPAAGMASERFSSGPV